MTEKESYKERKKKNNRIRYIQVGHKTHALYIEPEDSWNSGLSFLSLLYLIEMSSPGQEKSFRVRRALGQKDPPSPHPEKEDLERVTRKKKTRQSGR